MATPAPAPVPTKIDAFQGAEGSADAQKRALLAAIAQQGSIGRQSYDAEQNMAAQARQAAVQGASQRAGQIGAPAGLAAQLASTSPAGTYGADASAGAATLAAEQARASAANSTYMDQVRAAIPVSRTLADAYQAEALRKQEQDATDRKNALWDRANQRKWDLQDRNYETSTREEQRKWAEEDRMYEIAKRQAGGTGGGALASLVKNLGGEDLARTQLTALAKRALAANDTPTGDRPNNYGSADSLERQATAIDGSTPAGKRAILDSLGAQLGLPEGTLGEFLGNKNPTIPAKKGKTLSPQMTRNLRSKPAYAEWGKDITDNLTKARSKPADAPKGWRAPDIATVKDIIAANIRNTLGASQPLLAELLIRDYLHG